MDKAEGLKFWGIEPTKHDGNVYVWVDPEVKNRQFNKYDEDDDSAPKNGALNAGIAQRMGLSKQLEKDERIFALKQKIESGEWTTLEEAKDGMGVTGKTIIQYLNELGLTLKDGKIEVGSKTGEAKLVSNTTNNPTENYRKRFYKYYSADPSLGGEQITEDEHLKRVKDFKKGDL